MNCQNLAASATEQLSYLSILRQNCRQPIGQKYCKVQLYNHAIEEHFFTMQDVQRAQKKKIAITSTFVSRAQDKYQVSLFFSLASFSYFSRVRLSTIPVTCLQVDNRLSSSH